MPHDKPEEKEWLHLRDAICLGDVDAIVDQLSREGMDVHYDDLKEQLISLKTDAGWDACAVIDKDTFQESINHLISESIAIPQPWDAPEIKTYKDSMYSERWDRVFDGMVGRASGRIAAGPSHYTDETPEGALESMERRLAEVLAQMDLRVGELAEAVRQMGVAGVSVPVVEALEEAIVDIQVATEDITGVAPEPVRPPTGRTGRPPIAAVPWRESRSRNQAIRNYLSEQGDDLSNMTSEDVAKTVSEVWPGVTHRMVVVAWTNAVNSGLTLTRLKPMPLGPAPTPTPSPVVTMAPEPEPEPELPTDWRGAPNKHQALIRFMRAQGANLSNFTARNVADGVRSEWPDVIRTDTRTAWGGEKKAGRELPKLKPLPMGPPVGTPRPTPTSPPVVTTEPVVGRPAAPGGPRTLEELPPHDQAIVVYMQQLGAKLSDTTAEDIRDALIDQWPEITVFQIRNAWNILRAIAWYSEPRLPRPPMMRASERATGPIEATDVDAPPDDTLGGIFGGAPRPDRVNRNGDSWSRRYFFDLNDFQHDANDAWFEQMLSMLTPTGIMIVPTLQKAFNKRGQEVPFPGSDDDIPNRVIRSDDPPSRGSSGGPGMKVNSWS